jgi:hypothetical protein
MKYDCHITPSDAMEPAHSSLFEPRCSQSGFNNSAVDMPSEDDRYPGTFFRIPGIPVPGKTTWTVSK